MDSSLEPILSPHRVVLYVDLTCETAEYSAKSYIRKNRQQAENSKTEEKAKKHKTTVLVSNDKDPICRGNTPLSRAMRRGSENS